MRLSPKILYDPQFNLSGKARRHLMRRASNQWFKQPLNITIYIAFTLGWIALMVVFPRQLKTWGINSTATAFILWGGLYPLMFVAFYYTFYHFRLAKHTYHELRELGHDICPTCGYTLINLPKDLTQCPECGTTRSAPTPASTDQPPSS